MKKIISLLALLLTLSVPACHELAPEGVYQSDQALYSSELSITTSYELLHTFVKWEFDNRVALSGTPEIRKSADHIRRNVKQWFATAHALRDAYALDPTPENKSKLETSLRIIRTALSETSAYMLNAANSK